MRRGKKSVAEQIFYTALEIVEKRTKKPGFEVLQQAVENVAPVLEVRPRRVGGATYQVPLEVNPDRRITLAIRWLITYAAARGQATSMAEKLASEIIDAANNQGGAIKKREDVHKMAEANRAFAHYKW
jgi:small subunit ribosomal protein S7